jgi:CubicO group peptidase (beta-lactamase class C family)
VKSDTAAKEYCSVDSLDQGAMGLPCDNVLFRGSTLSFEVPLVHGRWSGTLNEGGNELKGTWSQGSDLPLTLTRQATALAPKKPEAPKYDPAMVAVPATELKSVLDHDIESALKSGALAPSTQGGIVIGVVQHGIRRIFAYGAAKEDQLFEIGSISKTFTGLILAQMVEQHKVKFEDPVRDLLPPGTVAKPEGPEITLLDLATQHSGLPRMPDNFHPSDQQDPYADYHAANLYEFIKLHGVTKPANAAFLYSNLGFGLLGQALANRAATTYPNLLRDEVTAPLNLKDTVIKLSPEQEKRFAQGHDAKHQEAHPWNLDAFAGAGAIRSTSNDMLGYLEAQLHPDTVGPADAAAGGATLSKALELSHQIRADVGPTTKIALAWLYVVKTGDYWHNGGTGGFSSYVAFNPKADEATVVLFNTTLGENGSFADRVGEHVMERLSGRPAVSLGN